jgi:ATP-dependent 26S proteasome regulatory subunit
MVEGDPSSFDMIGGLTEQIERNPEINLVPVKLTDSLILLVSFQPKNDNVVWPSPGTVPYPIQNVIGKKLSWHKTYFSIYRFIRVSHSSFRNILVKGLHVIQNLFVMAHEHAPSIIFMVNSRLSSI